MEAIVTLNFWKGENLTLRTEKHFWTIECGEKGLLELKKQILSITSELIRNWKGRITYDVRIVQHKVLDKWTMGDKVKI